MLQAVEDSSNGGTSCQLSWRTPAFGPAQSAHPEFKLTICCLLPCMQVFEPWHFDDKPEELGPSLHFREHSFLMHPEVQAAIEVRPTCLDVSLQACLHGLTFSHLAALKRAGLSNQHWHGTTQRWSTPSGALARAADGQGPPAAHGTSCWRQAAALQQCDSCLSWLH